MNKKVLIITTGGTIGGVVAERKVIKESEHFSKYLIDTIDLIKNKGIKLTINYFNFCSIDSSDFMPKQWSELAQKIKNSYDDYDAFIITHGTNTLGYTASALSFSLPNLGKPIVFTGSQVPINVPGSDGISNLENSLKIAVLNRSHGSQIKGVILVFGSQIITGVRVKKYTEFNYDAFKTFSAGSIGRIGRSIDINEANLSKHLSYLQSSHYRMAYKASDLICVNSFEMKIFSLTEFPGMDIGIFQTLVERHNIKGFILRAFGAGDASSRIIPALEYLASKEIPIVITTQAPQGNSNFQVNEPGQLIASRNLAIPAYDMSIESQTVKLSWLLAKKEKGELNYKQICNEMVNDIRGEVNVIWEVY